MWPGLDYLHGTGHGIGAYGEVHEGPILIRMKNSGGPPGKLQAGVFFSDEPGYYQVSWDWQILGHVTTILISVVGHITCSGG